MGWAGGSYLANNAWKLVREYVPEDKRKSVADSFLRLFEGEDADDFSSRDPLVVDAGRDEGE